jgi:hypothetical protein
VSIGSVYSTAAQLTHLMALLSINRDEVGLSFLSQMGWTPIFGYPNDFSRVILFLWISVVHHDFIVVYRLFVLDGALNALAAASYSIVYSSHAGHAKPGSHQTKITCATRWTHRYTAISVGWVSFFPVDPSIMHESRKWLLLSTGNCTSSNHTFTLP